MGGAFTRSHKSWQPGTVCRVAETVWGRRHPSRPRGPSVAIFAGHSVTYVEPVAEALAPGHVWVRYRDQSLAVPATGLTPLP